ncbi:MAG: hypothetical protein PEPC_01671 [Peptostreptococcus russellii]
MKTSIDSRQFDIAKVTFNGALQQVQDLNWNELKDLTKSSLLKYMSDLLILRSDYTLTEDQKMAIDIAEERLIKYISVYDKRNDNPGV